MSPIPIPRDIPLPLPLSTGMLEVLIVALFLAHILFVNLMLGGTLLALVFELRGRRRPELDVLAREVAATITVSKSLAVVLGVAPLLVINLLYTVHFYTANALTGAAWMAIVPLVATAFLLVYAYKYSWDALASRKGLHLAIGLLAAALFLFVPLIFLANINLMLFPERWVEVRGFFSALVLPNVVPRWLHFVTASVALTGLLLAGWFGRRHYSLAEELRTIGQDGVRRELLSVALGATGVQLVVGPLLYFTLPSRGLSWTLTWVVLAGASVAIAAGWLLWREITAPPREGLGGRYWAVVGLLTVTVVLMATGRHMYRERALEAHRAQVAQRTVAYEAEVLAAQMRKATGRQRLREEPAASPGERVFRTACMGCHARSTTLVGPPVTEMAGVYKGDPAALIAWVKAPGRKRAGYPQMPPVRLREDQYQAVAEYVLAAR